MAPEVAWMEAPGPRVQSAGAAPATAGFPEPEGGGGLVTGLAPLGPGVTKTPAGLSLGVTRAYGVMQLPAIITLP